MCLNVCDHTDFWWLLLQVESPNIPNNNLAITATAPILKFSLWNNGKPCNEHANRQTQQVTISFTIDAGRKNPWAEWSNFWGRFWGTTWMTW